MVTIQSADNVLKSYYLDAIKESIDLKANPLLAMVEKKSVNVVGKDVRKVVRVGVGGNVMAGSETGDLPTGASTTHVQLVSSLKNLYGTIEISDKALRASANDDGAFVNLLNEEMDALYKNVKFNFGRMLYGDGSGVLGYAKEFISNMVKVSNIHNFVEGMYVDFYNINENPIEGLQARKIIGVDHVNEFLYLEGAVDAPESVAGVGIYLHGSKNCDLTGLEAIFDPDFELYGIDKSVTSYAFMKSNVKYNVGDITDELMQETIDATEEQSGERINLIVTTNGVKRALCKYLREQGIVLPTIEIKGGFKALDFNGIPLVTDRFCPKGEMYFLNTNDFVLHQLCDWKWLEGEDGKILKQVPGKPVYTATLVKYAELMCDRPCGQAKLCDINEA